MSNELRVVWQGDDARRAGKLHRMMMRFYLDPFVRSMLLLRRGSAGDAYFKMTLRGVSPQTARRFGAFNAHQSGR